MKPRPLIKWKSFWLGILVLGFLGWAWNWSVERSAVVYAATGTKDWGFCSNSASLSFEVMTQPRTVPYELGFFTEMGHENVGYFAKAFSRDERQPIPKVTYRIAYWVVLPLCFLLWGAWLFFHWKREQKKTNA